MTIFPETPTDPDLRESATWRDIRGTWQPLHGSFFDSGLSVEWHDFHVDQEMDWAGSFHPGSLEICLNFSGRARIGESPLGPNQLAIYTAGRRRIPAVRHTGSLHRFITLELSLAFLRPHFSPMASRLKPAIRRFIERGAQAESHCEMLPLPASMLAARTHFVAPPVPAPARETWYLGRVLEILAQTLFAPEESGELFCERHHRTNRERIERARHLIERDLENPPSLEMLAAEMACSPFHLSRTFAQETGVSIPKFLRMKRVEKAAELIGSGKMNVTDAAMAVGYASLSAFTKAFVEQIGCCPGLYSLKLSRAA